jgi:hypothetical protein
MMFWDVWFFTCIFEVLIVLWTDLSFHDLGMGGRYNRPGPYLWSLNSWETYDEFCFRHCPPYGRTVHSRMLVRVVVKVTLGLLFRVLICSQVIKKHFRFFVCR